MGIAQPPPRIAESPDPTAASRFGYRPELRRTLGFTDLLAYGLIFMVPIAPMGIFGSVYNASGGMVALAYLIGMVALVFTAASYAQMVRAFPWLAASQLRPTRTPSPGPSSSAPCPWRCCPSSTSTALGFDGISMLAEENKGGAGQIGRAMAAALGVAGLLFIVQTWVAALLVPGADELRSQPQVEQIINTVEALVGETAVAVYR